MTYLPPTGAELRALLRRWELTGAVAADFVQCHPRTIRKWCGDERAMPFPALYTLVHRAAHVAVWPATWREDVRSIVQIAPLSAYVRVLPEPPGAET